jgi:hypothetical protein
MAPAAVADLFGGPTPVREHIAKQASVQASVLTGPKQLHIVCLPIPPIVAPACYYLAMVVLPRGTHANDRIGNKTSVRACIRRAPDISQKDRNLW